MFSLAKMIVPAAAMMVLSACQTANPEALKGARVNSDYTVRGTDEGQDTYFVAYNLSEIDGKIAICGAYKAISSSLARERAIGGYIKGLSAVYDGEVLSSLSFLRQTGGDINTARVNCKVTDRDAPADLVNSRMTVTGGGKTTYMD